MDRARTFLAGVKSNGNLLGMGRRYSTDVMVWTEYASANQVSTQHLRLLSWVLLLGTILFQRRSMSCSKKRAEASVQL